MSPHDLEWEALEYEHRDRTTDWYWGLGLMAAGGAVLSIFLGNVLFAGVIVLCAITLGMYAARPPKMERFAINERGIVIGNTLFPYQTLESFWVFDHHDHHPKLFVKSRKVFMPLMVIPITGVNPTHIREILLEVLPEEEHRESPAEHILHWFGF